MIRPLAFFWGLFIILNSYAAEIPPIFKQGVSYQDVKKELLANGWKPLQNSKILSSSLYAQELYEQGIVEIVDCVSMELDGCWFHFTKKNQVLEVRTITRQLVFEKLRLFKLNAIGTKV